MLIYICYINKFEGKNEIEDFKRPTQISLKFDIKSLSKAQFHVIHLKKIQHNPDTL